MVIEKILKQLTPERIKKEIEAIQEIRLPADLQKWVTEYNKVGDRDDFIWKWTYLGLEKITLSTVSKKNIKKVLIAKVISTILNGLMDDLADKKKNKRMLEASIHICSLLKNLPDALQLTSFSRKDRRYLILIKKIWTFLNSTIKKFPRYSEFEDLFQYDYQQFFNAMRYAQLINVNLNLINLEEFQLYSSHNMQGMIGGTIDLMVSPRFTVKELGPLREILWQAQRMGRIGNSLSTWKREIYEDDFSSEIFALALKKKIVSLEDLKKKDKEKIIQKIEGSEIESYFLEQWEKAYKTISILEKEITSFQVKKFLEGLEKLMLMHLSSVGLK